MLRVLFLVRAAVRALLQTPHFLARLLCTLAGRDAACVRCPAGTFSNPEGNQCLPCTPGYVCLGATRVATPLSVDGDGGYPCPAGGYLLFPPPYIGATRVCARGPMCARAAPSARSSSSTPPPLAGVTSRREGVRAPLRPPLPSARASARSRPPDGCSPPRPQLYRVVWHLPLCASDSLPLLPTTLPPSLHPRNPSYQASSALLAAAWSPRAPTVPTTRRPDRAATRRASCAPAGRTTTGWGSRRACPAPPLRCRRRGRPPAPASPSTGTSK